LSKDDYVLYCPKCNGEKRPDWVIGTRSYSAQRLDVPYFACGGCRLICIDRTVLRQAISSWRRDGLVSKNTPSHKQLYKEMLDVVNKVVDMYCQTAGYKRCRFRKANS